MTLEEVRQLAFDVMKDKTRSHVEAARELARFVLDLPYSPAPEAEKKDPP